MNYFFQLVLMAMAIFMMSLNQTKGIYNDFSRIPASNSTTNTASASINDVVPTMITQSTAAHAARGLLNASSWGVLSTIAYDRMNTPPFGNVVSYSDGGLGSPYLYLTARDNSTLNHALKDPRCSLTISQYPLGTCIRPDPQEQIIHLDPQEPTCAKLTLSGKLQKVQRMSQEFAFANATLFDRHPRYKVLPRRFFEIYKLAVNDIFVIRNYMRSPERPSVEEYYGINL